MTVPALLDAPALYFLCPLSLFTISFLPVLVGDYLAIHLALYGLLIAALTVRLRRGTRLARSMDHLVHSNPIDWRNFSLAALLLLLFSLPLAAVLNWQVASFWPTVERLPLLLAVSAETLWPQPREMINLTPAKNDIVGIRSVDRNTFSTAWNLNDVLAFFRIQLT